MNTNVIHHWLKKRKAEKRRNKAIKTIDAVIYVVALFGIIVTIPQVTKVWLEQNASGVSLISWSGYLIASLFWLAYGIIHREKPIIFAYLLWVVLDTLIVIGIIVYG
jgi:uncharacterized protein with PQ loop repeat